MLAQFLLVLFLFFCSAEGNKFSLRNADQQALNPDVLTEHKHNLEPAYAQAPAAHAAAAAPVQPKVHDDLVHHQFDNVALVHIVNKDSSSPVSFSFTSDLDDSLLSSCDKLLTDHFGVKQWKLVSPSASFTPPTKVTKTLNKISESGANDLLGGLGIDTTSIGEWLQNFGLDIQTPFIIAKDDKTTSFGYLQDIKASASATGNSDTGMGPFLNGVATPLEDFISNLPAPSIDSPLGFSLTLRGFAAQFTNSNKKEGVKSKSFLSRLARVCVLVDGHLDLTPVINVRGTTVLICFKKGTVQGKSKITVDQVRATADLSFGTATTIIHIDADYVSSSDGWSLDAKLSAGEGGSQGALTFKTIIEAFGVNVPDNWPPPIVVSPNPQQILSAIHIDGGEIAFMQKSGQTTFSITSGINFDQNSAINQVVTIHSIDLRLTHTHFNQKAKTRSPPPAKGLNILFLDVIASLGKWTLPLSVPMSLLVGPNPIAEFLFAAKAELLKIPSNPNLIFYLPPPPRYIVPTEVLESKLPSTTIYSCLQAAGISLSTSSGLGQLLHWLALDEYGLSLSRFQFSIPSSSAFNLDIAGLVSKIGAVSSAESMQLTFTLHLATNKQSGKSPLNVVLGFGMSWSYLLIEMDHAFDTIFNLLHVPSVFHFKFSSVFGWLNIDNVQFLIANTDTQINTLPGSFTKDLPDSLTVSLKNTIMQGFTALGVVKINPSANKFSLFLSKVVPSLVSGIPFFYNMGLESFQFAVVVGSFALTDHVQFQDNTVAVSAGFAPTGPKKMGVEFGMSTHLVLNFGDFHFDATGSIAFNPELETLTVQVTTGAPFKHAFGVPFLTIEYITVGGTIGTVAPWLLAINGGVSLDVDVMNLHVKATTLFGIDLVTPKNNYFYGNITPIVLMDIFRTAGPNVAKYVPKFIGDIGFPSGMSVSFSPLGTTVPLPGHDPVIILPGFHMNGIVALFGVEVYTNIDISTGPIPSFRLNLVMYRALCLGKGHQVCLMDFTDPNKGPNLDVSFAATSFFAHASLRARIFSREVAAKLDLDISGLSVIATMDLFTGLTASFQLKASAADKAGMVKFSIDARKLWDMLLAKLHELKDAANKAFKVANDKLQGAKNELSKKQAACKSSCSFSCPQIGGGHSFLEVSKGISDKVYLESNYTDYDSDFASFSENDGYYYQTQEYLYSTDEDMAFVEDEDEYPYDADLPGYNNDTALQYDGSNDVLPQEEQVEYGYCDFNVLSNAEIMYSLNNTIWDPPQSSFMQLASRARWSIGGFFRSVGHAISSGVKNVVHKVGNAVNKIVHKVVEVAKSAGKAIVKTVVAVTNKVLQAGCSAGTAICTGGCKAAMEVAIIGVTGAQYAVNTVGKGFSLLIDVITSAINLFRIDFAELEADISKDGFGGRLRVDYTFLGGRHSFQMSIQVTFSSIKSFIESLFQELKNALLHKSGSSDPQSSGAQTVQTIPSPIQNAQSKITGALTAYASKQSINMRVSLSPKDIAAVKATGAKTINKAPKLNIVVPKSPAQIARERMLHLFGHRSRLETVVESESESKTYTIEELPEFDPEEAKSLIQLSTNAEAVAKYGEVVLKLEVDPGGPHHSFIPLANRVQQQILKTGQFFAVIPGLNIGDRSVVTRLVIDHAHHDPRVSGRDVIHRMEASSRITISDYKLNVLSPILRPKNADISLTAADPSQSVTTIVQLIPLEVGQDENKVYIHDLASAGIAYLLHQGKEVGDIPATDHNGVLLDTPSAVNFLNQIADLPDSSVSTKMHGVTFQGIEVEKLIAYSKQKHRNLIVRLVTFNLKSMKFKVQAWTRIYHKPECTWGEMSFVHGAKAHLDITCDTDGSRGVHGLQLQVVELPPLPKLPHTPPTTTPTTIPTTHPTTHAPTTSNKKKIEIVKHDSPLVVKGSQQVELLDIVLNDHGHGHVQFDLHAQDYAMDTRLVLTVKARVTSPISLLPPNREVEFALTHISRTITALSFTVQPIISKETVLHHLDKKGMFELPVDISNPHYTHNAHLYLVSSDQELCESPVAMKSKSHFNVPASDPENALIHTKVEISPKLITGEDATFNLLLCDPVHSAPVLFQTIAIVPTSIKVEFSSTPLAHHPHTVDASHFEFGFIRVAVVAPGNDASWVVYIQQASPALPASSKKENLLGASAEKTLPKGTLLWSFLPPQGEKVPHHDALHHLPTGNAHVTVKSGKAGQAQLKALETPRVIEFHTAYLPDQATTTKDQAEIHYQVGLYNPSTKENVIDPVTFKLTYFKALRKLHF